MADGRGKNPNSAKNLKKFSSEYQPPTQGRKPGTRSRKDLLRRWLEVPMNINHPVTREKLNVRVEDTIVLSLIAEAQKGNISAIKEILDSTYGKLTEHVEVKIEDLSQMSDAELLAIAQGKLPKSD